MAPWDYLTLWSFLRAWWIESFSTVIVLTFYRCHPAHFLQTLLQNRPLWCINNGEKCFESGEGRVQGLPLAEPQSQSGGAADWTVSGNLCSGWVSEWDTFCSWDFLPYASVMWCFVDTLTETAAPSSLRGRDIDWSTNTAHPGELTLGNSSAQVRPVAWKARSHRPPQAGKLNASYFSFTRLSFSSSLFSLPHFLFPITCLVSASHIFSLSHSQSLNVLASSLHVQILFYTVPGSGRPTANF